MGAIASLNVSWEKPLSDGHPDDTEIYHGEKDEEPAPVLNVVWEPVEGGAAQTDERSTRMTRAPLQLISSTQLYVKRFDPSKRCIVEQPVIANMYVEPYVSGEAGKCMQSLAPTQSLSESGPPLEESTPSITLTETKTKTTITRPHSGFSKRVTEVHTKIKQVKVCPETGGMFLYWYFSLYNTTLGISSGT
ncbi:hypothetical protein GCK32_010511 [Trichostrongylus colubriformis]|uniref:Uncharacterized protein n=1 Tax=Trichostrongylus colubriformis TaxID=6319 RepID=A0AAN8F1T9_TRICO